MSTTFRVFAFCTIGLIFLNFIGSVENLVCAFSNPAISIVQHPSIVRAIHERHNAMVLPPTSRKSRLQFQLRAKEASAGAENGVALPLRNFQEESIWLQDEVRRWLDVEWIPRPIHAEIGACAARTLEKQRSNGVSDVASLLFTIAEDLQKEINFYDSDVNNWDVANKCADLLLQSVGRDVCCTSQPFTACPSGLSEAEGAPAADYLAPVPAEARAFEMPTSAFDRHVFLQQALDGRLEAAVVNRAVLESLGVPVVTTGPALAYDTRSLPGEVAGCGAVPDFVGDDCAAEALDSILAARLREENKREEDLEPYLEALVGEGALAALAGDPGFVRRRLCVTWLLFSAS